jgi:hypothetical protein
MFSSSWGFGSRRRLPGPVARVIRLVVGIALVVFMGVRIGPAISAAEGHGARGYFVAQAESCGRHGCSWSGLFRLPGGQVSRSDVTFDGSHPGMHIGSVVPALDSGDFSDVFPRHGGDSWLFDLAAGVIGICLVGQTFWTWARRRLGADRITAGGRYTGAGPADPGMPSSPAPM